jgi:hypothetical protein
VDSIVDDHFATEKHGEVRQIQYVIILQIMIVNTNMFCDKKLLDLMIPNQQWQTQTLLVAKAA